MPDPKKKLGGWLLEHMPAAAADATATSADQLRRLQAQGRAIGPRLPGNLPLPEATPEPTREGWLMEHLADVLPVVGEMRGVQAGHEAAQSGHPIAGAAMAAAGALPIVGRLAREASLPRIARAAIMLPDGSIHWGTNHASAIDAARLAGSLPKDWRSPKYARLLAGATDGFVDEAGNFLNRDETLQRLRDLGKKIGGEGFSSEELHFIPAKQRAKYVAPDNALPFGGVRPFGETYPAVPSRYAILTAENPNGQPLSAAENRARNAKLAADLKQRGLTFSKVKGAYTDETSGKTLRENSFLVHNIEPRDAEDLGARYEQNGVITHQGYHDLANGKLFPSSGVEFTDEMPYTQLANGTRIRSKIDWSAPQAMSDATSVARPDPAVTRAAQFDRLDNVAKKIRPSADSIPERIVATAVQHGASGRIFTGPIHAFAREEAINAGLGGGRFTDGFVTNTGRFVGRREAQQIASAAEQPVRRKMDRLPELSSEDFQPGALNTEAREVPQGWNADATRRAAMFQQLRAQHPDWNVRQIADAIAASESKVPRVMGDSIPARVAAAAVRLPDGSIHTGRSHWPAIEAAIASGKLPPATDPAFEKMLQQSEDGFVDANGQFLTRTQATQRLRATGHNIPRGFPAGSMTSEEVRGFGGIPDSIVTRALPAAGKVFDESRLGTDLPPGFTADRPPVRYPTARADLSMLGDIGARVRRIFTPNAEKALAENPRAGGWYDTSQLRDAFANESPTGLNDFKQFMLFHGPTSTGTTVPQNIRQASLFYQLWKNGQLDLDALKNSTLSLPYGYANRRQKSVNSGIARILENGNLDPLTQPKTFRYSNQLAGTAWGGTALDMHVGRQVGKQGMLEMPNGELERAVGFPEPSYNDTRRVSTSPPNSHYPVIEDALVQEANRLGLPPAVYQALGWVGGAKRTNVADPRTMTELLNEILKNTATKFNRSSPTDALRGFIAGENPLWD